MGSLNYGDLVLLIDSKDRRYLLTLEVDKEFHTHSGYLSHNDLVKSKEGEQVKLSSGKTYLLVRPTMSDVILKCLVPLK